MANLKHLKNPLIIPSVASDWPCQSWTFEILSEILGSKLFSCRVSEKSCACGQKMETHYNYHMITLKQFCEWLQGNSQDGPLIDYSREKYSCYIDYKYMKDMFSDVPHFFNEVQWRDLGLCDFDGYDSTIWLGSEGANTPGHQDTYGFNLVAQVFGRKLWILFPPEDSPFLYPTRIPYEESSIFTQVNLRNPDLTIHPKFKLSHPVIVTLCPGQILYVPRHWWHYVESLEPSISINVWVPVKADCQSHLSEAITRCLVTSLISTLDLSENNLLKAEWLNPKETLDSMEDNLTYLKTALNLIAKSKMETSGDEHHGLNEGGEAIKEICEVTRTEANISYEDRRKSPLHHDNMSDTQLSSDTEKNYLNLLYDRLKQLSMMQGASPFQLCNDSRGKYKRKLSSPRCDLKKQKLSPHQIHIADLQEIGSRNETLEACVIEKQESAECEVYSLSPCSIESYLTFIDSLCQRNKCTCLLHRADPSESTSLTSSIAWSPKSTTPPLEPPNSFSGDQCLPSAVCVASVSQTTNFFHCLPFTADSSETNLVGTKQLESRNKLSLLCPQEIAENLLASVLHPEVINVLSQKFLDMCLLSQSK